MPNNFQQSLPEPLFREVFKRCPTALFERLSPEQEAEIKRAVCAVRDDKQRLLLKFGREIPTDKRIQLDDDIRALNGVL